MSLQQNHSPAIRLHGAWVALVPWVALIACAVLSLGAVSDASAQATSETDSTEAGLLERLQSRDRGFYSDELLQGNHTFRDTSIARFDSLGMKAWAERADKNRKRFDFEFDPAFAACVQEYAAVGRFIDPTPFEVQFVIGILCGGSHITVGLADAVDDAVFDGPYVIDVDAFVVYVQLPAGEILTVEQLSLLRTAGGHHCNDHECD